MVTVLAYVRFQGRRKGDNLCHARVELVSITTESL